MSDIEDLLGFLSNDNTTQVVSMALEIVEGLSATPSGLEALSGEDVRAKLLPDLLRHAAGPSLYVSEKALNALINLSTNETLARELVSCSALTRCMDLIREEAPSPHALIMMLLANLSHSEAGARQILQVGEGTLEGLNMAHLLGFFTKEVTQQQQLLDDPYEQIASVVNNVTQLPEGRSLMLEPGRGLLQAAVMQLKSRSVVRRRGSACAVRNCCLSAEADGTVDQLVEDTAVLRGLCQPVSGEAPFEDDDTVREAVAEAIQLLVDTSAGSDKLWEMGVHEQLRKGYEKEQHPGVCEAMEKTIASFAAYNKGTEDLVDEEAEAEAEPRQPRPPQTFVVGRDDPPKAEVAPPVQVSDELPLTEVE